MIKILHLTCTDESGNPVITDATFDIHTDDRVAILCGEQERATILCHAVAGILHRTYPAHHVSGTVYFNEQPIDKIETHVRTEMFAYVPPNSDLLISGVKDTVFGEIALSLELTGTEPDVIREKVSSILHRLSIENLATRDPDELSGGERHKVALASMIVREPDILILDNPSMFLDHSGVHNLLSILRDYHGIIILADSNPYIWTPIADRFLIVVDSSVNSVDSSDELFYQIKKGNLQIELPAWTDLYIKLQTHLSLPSNSKLTNSVNTLRIIARAIK